MAGIRAYRQEGALVAHPAGLDEVALSFVAGYGQLGSQETLVARSWDLGALEQRYEDFIEEFTGLDPVTGEAALVAQIRLLPENWSGTKAADLFHARHADWHPAAQRHWQRHWQREPDSAALRAPCPG